MNAVQIGKYRCESVPGSFDELKPEAFVRIASRLLRGIRKDVAQLRFTQFILDVKWNKPRLWWEWWVRMSAYERHYVLGLSEWCFQSAPIQHTFVIREFRGLIGPAADLEDTTAEEWGVADAWFGKWTRSKDDEALTAFIATLYRPKRRRQDPVIFRGDRREPFEVTQFEHINKVKKWPEHIRAAIVFNYRNIRRMLETENPHVFGDATPQTASIGNGWGDVILNLSGDKFGPHLQTSRTRIRPFLREHNARIERHNKEQERIKNMKLRRK